MDAQQDPDARIADALPLDYGAEAQQLATLRTILDSISDAIFVLAPDGAILDANAAVLRLYGVSRAEARASSFGRDFSGPGNPPGLLARHWAEAAAGSEQQLRWQARRPGAGDTFPAELTLRRLELPGREAMLATVRDTSADSYVQAALADELAFTTALLDTLGALVVVVDRSGAIVRFNRACQELTGYTMSELRDPAIWQAILLPEEAPGVSAVAAAIFAGRYPLRHENVWVTRSGERRHIAWSNTALLDTSGRPTHMIGTGIDLTDQRRLEAAYAQAQRMESVGRLAGGIAHDFNNLLTVMCGAAELALSTLPAEHRARADVRTILQAADRASALTRQLLAFARRQGGETRVLDLPALVADLRPMLERLVPEHVALELAFPPDLWAVQGDPGQLEQVLINLVVNARDAMPDGGRLRIAAAASVGDAGPHPDLQQGQYVQLTVADTGLGMSPDVRDRAFEPFFTTKAAGQGTGLGLATCYGIVRRHGGAIWLDSEPGRGTTVTLLLPAVPEPGARPEGGRGEAPAGAGEVILLVEDNEAVRAVTARMLRGRGYTVIEAAGGAEALGLAEAWGGPPIALLLTDVVMPELSGPDLAVLLQARSPALPVLFMSGYTEDPLIQTAVRSAEVAFIAKPFSAAALAEEVRRALRAGRR